MSTPSSPEVDATPLPATSGAAMGLDLSLTSTGLAWGEITMVIKPRGRGVERLRDIRTRIFRVCHSMPLPPALVVVEGPAFSRVGSGQHERGGLWWFIVETLDSYGYPTAVVSPTALKKFATGKGNAGKDDMVLAAARRFPWFAGGNDEADALWLAAMGADHLGRPLVDMPAVNRTALDKVLWPTAVTS